MLEGLPVEIFPGDAVHEALLSPDSADFIRVPLPAANTIATGASTRAYTFQSTNRRAVNPARRES